jgi:predicted CopG family antitoxin
MSTKTISLKIEAYEKLRAVRRYPDESFSEIILRAVWPEDSVTAGELLQRVRSTRPLLSEEPLDRIEEASKADTPPKDKWAKR